MQKYVKKIQSIFNRCIIFNTCQGSFHGHPQPLKSPKEIKRKSLVLYYFGDEGSRVVLSPTNYRSRPDEKIITKILISMIEIFLGLKDKFIQKILKKYFKIDFFYFIFFVISSK